MNIGQRLSAGRATQRQVRDGSGFDHLSIVGGVMQTSAISVFTALILVTGPAVVKAQNQPGSASNAEPGEGASLQIEEVTVTARRREESELQTPISLTALSGEALEERGIDNFVTMGSFVPNLAIGSAPTRGTSTASFSIRGIGNWIPNINDDPTVGVYVDDVYYQKATGALLDLIDVERVEVLRGPQGTLFGKNTMGGAIRYFTAPPGEEFGGRVKVALGDYGRQDVEAAVDLPLADEFALRLTGALKQRDGYITRVIDGVVTGDEDVEVLRMQMRWTPGEWEVKASFDDTETKSDGPPRDIPYACPWVPGGPPVVVNCLFPFLFNVNTGQVFDDSWVTPDLSTVYGGKLESDRVRRQGAGLSFQRSFENITFTAITGAQQGDQSILVDWDESPLTLFDALNAIDYEYWTQEFQLTGVTANDRLNWTAGIFYFSEDSSSFAPAGGFQFGVPALFPDVDTRESTSTALYVQGTYAVTDRLDVTVGARSTEDEEHRTALNGTALVANDGTWDTVDPKLSVELNFTDDIMGYVSASRGYRPGTFTNFLVNGVQELRLVDEEELWNYEVGVKSRLIDGRLQLTAALFNGDYDDIQVTTIQTDPVSNQVFTPIENAAKAHVDGAEIEFQALVSEKLLLRGSYASLDTGYDEVDPTSTLNPNASKFIRAPENSYTIGLQYVTTLSGRGAELSWNLDYGWKDDHETTNTGTNNVTIEAYGLLNGRVQYAPPGGRWTVAMLGTNLTDEPYLIGGFDSAMKEHIIGVVQHDYGRPREYAVQVSVDF
jgi:iron complex outermembrane recepter protein